MAFNTDDCPAVVASIRLGVHFGPGEGTGERSGRRPLAVAVSKAGHELPFPFRSIEGGLRVYR